MPQKIQVRFTGNKGQVDGYVESMIGMFAMSGMLLQRPKFNKRYRSGEVVQIYCTLHLKDSPLGNLGEADFPEHPFEEGESE